MNEIIDFHTHILPCIDDGSSSIDESLAMLQMEAQQGIQNIVFTPHFYPQTDTPDRFLSRRAEAVESLQTVISNQLDLSSIHIGAEVHYFRGMSDYDALSALTIGESDCILIEMPASPWKSYMFDELVEIRSKQNLIPILAHVDRYIRPFLTYGIPEKLEELPVLVQANANFFLRRSTSRMALKMLQKGQIHLLGSDCHNLIDRKPNLGQALDVIQCRLGPDPIVNIYQYQRDILK